MTKAELMKRYEEVKEQASSICLFIHMPTGETEIITNPNVVEKITYIDKTYNDELVHSNCKDIYIEDVYFSAEGDTYDFGTAINFLKDGLKVARKGWNGKGMFLFLAESTDIQTKADLSECEHMRGELVLPSIVMKTADDHFCVGWLASQTDMLAEDWVIVE